MYISIDSIHFHIITKMAEPNPNAKLLQLLRRKSAELGRGHFFPARITNQNALLCLATATNQEEFDYVMAYICYNFVAVFDRPGSDSIILFHQHEIMMRALRWVIRELNRTDDNNE
mmetsp:Transcript_11356/g.22706  ORF Transcript_11356/g.22706 Transcript_11356/m.22706 type:complete len:116 (-) Transcript_11356:226-573(-)